MPRPVYLARIGRCWVRRRPKGHDRCRRRGGLADPWFDARPCYDTDSAC
ncbi:hypothetical protein ACIQZB_42100 [Streptomyces sp. NPDC097727]